MKVLFINSVCGIRSTGRICTDLATQLEKEGHQVKIAYGRETVPPQYEKYAVRIGTDWDTKLSAVHTRITDRHGFANKRATRKFLQWAESYGPDLLWLHNIHGYYINVEMLFAWIKKHPQMEVRWTLHDCWSFTGHCSHFSLIGCDQWKNGCQKCAQKGRYPASAVMDNCKENYIRKKNAFTGVTNMTLIAPCKWLAGLVKESYLGSYPVEVHYNTIDTGVFQPTPGDFRERAGLQEKKIVLGVASAWDERKGLDDFIKLAEMLDETHRVVLVGLSEKQLQQLPGQIYGIARTNSAKELAEIYTAADVFVNLTYEDNYPTVNLEARACGTPVITYNTGGSPESAGEDATVLAQGDLEGIKHAIEALTK